MQWQSGPYPAHVWAAPPAHATPGGPKPRWGATVALAALIGAVVLGGVFADGVVAAPSAGTVAVSGPVTITAAPGWIVSDSAGPIADGVALQHSSAVLFAQVLSTGYPGDDRRLLEETEASFRSELGQISFGESRVLELGGREASEATFTALVSSGGSSGLIDGELVCMVVKSGGNSYAVLVQVGVPQGYLDTVASAVDTMAASVKAAP